MSKPSVMIFRQRVFEKRFPKFLYYFIPPRFDDDGEEEVEEEEEESGLSAAKARSFQLALPEIRVTSPSSAGREEFVVQERQKSPVEITTTNNDFNQEKESGEQKCHADEVDRLPRELRVEGFDLLCYLFSMLTYLADICLDVLVAYMHYANKRYLSSAIIASLVVFPSLILNAVAASWWIDDEISFRQRQLKLKAKRQNVSSRYRRSLLSRLIICLLQLGPVLWYVEALEAAFRFRKEMRKGSERRSAQRAFRFYCRMVEAERDASLLRFFESFLESVPQLLVQGLLVAQYIWDAQAKSAALPDWVRLQMVSMACSLLSASWSMVAQHRSLRLACPSKFNMLYRDSVLQLFWRAFTITARYICLIMFILAYREWIMAVFALHYSISLIHITALQAIFTSTGAFSRTSFVNVALALINAAIHLFVPFNMAEGTTRWQYGVAYSIEFLEGTILMSLCLWNPAFDYPYKECIAGVALACFVMGILVMLAYYEFFHPSRRRIWHFGGNGVRRRPPLAATFKRQNAVENQQPTTIR